MVQKIKFMLDEIKIKPIGVLHSDLAYRYETPRQGVLAGEKISVIELLPKMNFEQAVKDLDGFDRIWVIYQFHLNPNWKPLVSPPRHTRKKIGLFATRSPHRPSQIGMSCVKLVKIDGLKIFISESDILDGSPVLDIKPYLPYSDSFPESKTGWVKSDSMPRYEVSFSEKAENQCKWLKEEANINLENFARLQLEFAPTDTSRKRISNFSPDNNKADQKFILAYRTWRIVFQFSDGEEKVEVIKITSGYTNDELQQRADKYEDKKLHKKFIECFSD